MQRSIERESGRLVVWTPVLIGLGIGMYFSLPSEPSRVHFLMGLAVLGLFSAVVFRRIPETQLISLWLVLVGFGAAMMQADRLAAPVLDRDPGSVTITGQITGLERFQGHTYRMVIVAPEISRLNAEDTPHKVRLTVRTRGDAVLPGDIVQLRAKIMPPSAPEAPGAFDFARRAWFQQLGAVGYAISPVTRLERAAPTGFTTKVARFRAYLIDRLLVQAEGEAGAMAVALLTGARNLMAEESQEAMRDAGLAHLLAISGLHIGLVATSVMLWIRALLSLVPAIALRYPIKKIAAVVGLSAALLYLAVSGATIPTQRAFAMTAIVLVAIVIDRLAITLRLVSVVAVGLLLVSPDVLLNVSFQMSFGAVVALVAFYEKMRGTRWLTGRRQSWLRSVAVYAAGVCMTSLIAGFATGFIAAFHFNRYANWGLAANLVAVPIMALWIMPAAILTFLLLPFGLESYGLTLMTIGIELVLLSAHTVAGWDYAVLLVPAMPMSAFVATMVGALWLCLWSQNWRYWGIVMIGLGMWVGIATRQPDILVNAKGTLFAVQDHKNAIVVSSKKAGRRARETWLRRNGQKSAGKWSDLDDGLLVQCDSLSCVYRPPDRPDLKVAMVKSTAALPEDCQRADIVISAVPTRYWCPETKLVIDRFDLWRAGAHAIWIESDEIIVETVAGHRGRRPWNAQPPKNR